MISTRLGINWMYITSNVVDRSYRLATYRQFIHWTCSRLDRGICRVIPSCIVATVCHEFPEDGIYTGFKLEDL